MTVIFPIVTFSLVWFAFSVHADFQKIKFKNCKSVFNITNVEVNGCVGSSQRHCAFRRGTTPHLRIEFVPTRTTETLETAVRAKIAGGVIVSFNLEQKDPCKGGNLTCPLKEGKTYYYQQGVTILKEYPMVDNVQINWLLNDKSNDGAQNDANKREICIIFLAKIIE
uniref:MD-2-related lipid-recognition domain-containing protein n=1 Tax=Wuchereria bancrofti TaxID=6293 RepID=A0AAF5PWQ7_WUCBA